MQCTYSPSLFGFSVVFLTHFYSFSIREKRFNVLGAINALTHQIIAVTNQSYINAESFCELLDKLAALYLNIPITLILDNARYQKCHLV
jgi:hypothetical protein